jgi:hypothetical protein
MFCHLNYQINKKLHREYYFQNCQKAVNHTVKKDGKVLYEHEHWQLLFNIDELVNPIIKDLGLQGMNIWPRYSYIQPNNKLNNHIDVDRIVGINFNLMDTRQPSLNMPGQKIYYEACLADVGSVMHSVEMSSDYRLVLKLAIREPWAKVFDAVESSGYLDHQETYAILPNYKNYVSKPSSFYEYVK